ncbi:MAG TPA: hypothetical protein VF066_11820 [Thermoleophilaceae bacterium]
MAPRIFTAIVIAVLVLSGHVAGAQAPAANQMVVAAIPEELVGFSLSEAGPAASNTITVDVRRETVGDTTIVTIVPRD